MKLHILNPGFGAEPVKQTRFGDVLGSAILLSTESLRAGPPCNEDDASEALAVPQIVTQRIAAERERGIDALVIDCFGDPGVRELREPLRIPVTCPGEAGKHLAATLGRASRW